MSRLPSTPQDPTATPWEDFDGMEIESWSELQAALAVAAAGKASPDTLAQQAGKQAEAAIADFLTPPAERAPQLVEIDAPCPMRFEPFANVNGIKDPPLPTEVYVDGDGVAHVLDGEEVLCGLGMAGEEENTPAADNCFYCAQALATEQKEG